MQAALLLRSSKRGARNGPRLVLADCYGLSSASSKPEKSTSVRRLAARRSIKAPTVSHSGPAGHSRTAGYPAAPVVAPALDERLGPEQPVVKLGGLAGPSLSRRPLRLQTKPGTRWDATPPGVRGRGVAAKQPSGEEWPQYSSITTASRGSTCFACKGKIDSWGVVEALCERRRRTGPFCREQSGSWEVHPKGSHQGRLRTTTVPKSLM